MDAGSRKQKDIFPFGFTPSMVPGLNLKLNALRVHPRGVRRSQVCCHRCSNVELGQPWTFQSGISLGSIQPKLGYFNKPRRDIVSSTQVVASIPSPLSFRPEVSM